MFAKANGSTIGETPWCYWCIYCRCLPQWCLLRQFDRLLDKQPDAFDIFSADFASIMFAKTNESTVG